MSFKLYDVLVETIFLVGGLEAMTLPYLSANFQARLGTRHILRKVEKIRMKFASVLAINDILAKSGTS